MNKKSRSKVTRTPSREATADCQSNAAWRSGVLLPSLASTMLALAAFPPLNWSWLAWVAPLGWLVVCQRSAPVGRSGYWALWMTGCLFWLVTLHSVRLAFWALYAGWIAISLYLAAYIPAFVASTRVMVHRWKVPLVLAAPIAWTGMEMIRSYFLTGYAANTLAHSQAYRPIAIQLVDQLGASGLSFLMMMLAASSLKAYQRFRSARRVHAIVPAATGLLVLFIVLGYGRWRLQQAEQLYNKQPPMLRVLLLQENTPSVFEMSPDLAEYFERTESYWTRYLNLCRSAVQQHGPVDLVVWPESAFTAGRAYVQMNLEEGRLPGELKEEMKSHGVSTEELQARIAQSNEYFYLRARLAVDAARGRRSGPDSAGTLPASDLHEPGLTNNEQAVGKSQSKQANSAEAADSIVPEREQGKRFVEPSLLVGCDHLQYTSDEIRRHNAALWIGADGKVVDHYSKMHLVMFGEYIPLKPLLSWLGELFRFADAVPGSEPKSFEIDGVLVAPNICFESMVPWLIRWQVQELRNQKRSPQVLINLTNDSWFRGTVMLDHHLASSIMCSVENRLPMLVAANTGISAELDGSGRVLQMAERLTAQALLAEPRADGRWGLVQSAGYPLSWMCVFVSLIALLGIFVPKQSAGLAQV